MDDINYQHLRYFWYVAREGSVSGAARRLRLSASTISTQVRALEEQLGRPLLERRGRGMALTEYGQLVLEYADDIFAIGSRLQDAARSETRLRHSYRLGVGISNNLPKSVAYQLLAPALHLDAFPVQLVCRQDHPERLLADLALHHIELVLSDAPIALSSDVSAESILLGGTSVSLLGTPGLVTRYLAGFPESLEGAPLLLPEAGSSMRHLVERFLEARNLRPRIVAEFGDSALLKFFGQEGAGLFPVASLVANAVCIQYRCVVLGELDPALQEHFFAIASSSKRSNPAIRAVLTAATSALSKARGPG